MQVEFISYNGEYPCLCYGDLTLKINGKEMTFECPLISGGHCSWNEDGDEIIRGNWVLNQDAFEKFTEEEQGQILKVVNENVPHGCCGGCI